MDAGIAMALAGGSWIFLGFTVVLFFGVVIGFYTVKGSGITPRPYGKMYSGSPGARGASSGASGRDDRERLHNWSRGTR